MAAGNGSRVQGLTKTATGESVPKQFCSLNRRECLFELALERAYGIAGPQRTCAVVAAQHRRWWSSPLLGMPLGNIFVQPENRGTGVGMLFSLLHIEGRDKDATVVFLPADHSFRDENTLARSVKLASRFASANPDRIYVLGAKPQFADPEMSYIVPTGSTTAGLSAVKEVAERPYPELAAALTARGALWNMSIVAASVGALLKLFPLSFGYLVDEMRAAIGSPLLSYRSRLALGRLYADMPALDFERDVLSSHPEMLKLQQVPFCGWSDLGTPARASATIQNTQRLVAQQEPTSARYLDLVQTGMGLGRMGALS
jgi:mannose-1-phosphate guanylyltransferase